jgi:hypothetical protein
MLMHSPSVCGLAKATYGSRNTGEGGADVRQGRQLHQTNVCYSNPVLISL